MKRLVRGCIAVSAALALLCSCGNNGMSNKFARLKAEAESKSGIIYRTTFYVENDAIDGMPYPERDGEDGNYRFVYRNENGKTVAITDYDYEDAHGSYEVDENKYFAPARTNGKWGYLLLDTSESGEEAYWEIEPQYDNAERFSEQLAAVMKDGKYGAINENGELVIPMLYDSMKYCTFAMIPVEADGEWYFINGNGEAVYGPFEDAESYYFGYAAVKKNGKWGFINKSGIDATDYVYDEVYSMDAEGGAWVCADGKWEYVVVRE